MGTIARSYNVDKMRDIKVHYNLIFTRKWKLSSCLSDSGLGSIPELEFEAMELELELQNGIDRNWNGIEDFISIPSSILLIFPLLSSARMLIMHIDVSKIVKVFCKERIFL